MIACKSLSLARNKEAKNILINLAKYTNQPIEGLNKVIYQTALETVNDALSGQEWCELVKPRRGDIINIGHRPMNIITSLNKHTMPQSLSKVYVHITFSTKYRQNLIDEAIEEELYTYLGGVCKALKCNPIRVGGYKNHVHILCTLARTVTQSKLLEEVKKQSSKEW